MPDLSFLTQFKSVSFYLSVNAPLTLVLICHFLGDFHLQSQKLADQKKQKFKALVIHLFWVGLPLLLTACFLHSELRGYFFKVWLAHALIDFIKYLITKRGLVRESWEKYIFILDQILHLTAIFCLFGAYRGLMVITDIPLSDYPTYPVLNVFLFLLIISKPVNILFKLFFRKYQPVGEEAAGTVEGAGALIGQLERLIMGIFLLFGQYAAIGLVFTAKSIARFDRISKSQAFAEYYLIGSLFSIISVLMAYALCLG